MFSDTQTTLVFSILLVSFLGLLQLWLWQQDRALVVLGVWGGAHVLGAVGLILLYARGTIPNRLSIDVANAMILLTYALVWMGARRFERKPVSFAVMLGGPLAWLIACQIPAFYPSLAYRAALISAITGFYDLLTMREFLRHRADAALPSRRALGVMFGAHAVLMAVRTIASLWIGFDNAVFDLPGATWLGVPTMIGIMLIVGMSVLLIAVAKEAAEQRSTTTLALARDTADRANLAKTRFLARMSHELRTPLNGVLGLAQALTRDPSLRGEQRERAVLLEQAGRHLLAIVNDLLDLARVESGKFELAPLPMRLAGFVRGSIDLVAETAAARQVTLQLDLATDLPDAVLADALRLRQILLNLLGNAIKFTPPGGRVLLAVARPPGGLLRFTVTDTGPGVAPDIAPYLFQDFMQRPINARASDGAGLGLAISASLVQAMSGTIAYRPVMGGIGSVFTVELPLPVAEPPPEPAPPLAPTVPEGLQVLVVDDVASNRKLADVLLRQAGFAVDLAADGPTALQALARAPMPDVVLMDVHMPGMDGLATARCIRALDGAVARVPIIALTADSTVEGTRACHDAGMNACVMKPLDFPELLTVIAQVLPQREPATT